jgi:hypothetical protein
VLDLGAMNKVYQLVTQQDGAINDRRYFESRDHALTAGQQSADIYAAMIARPMIRTDLNRYGVVVAWEDEPRSTLVVIYEGEVED